MASIAEVPTLEARGQVPGETSATPDEKDGSPERISPANPPASDHGDSHPADARAVTVHVEPGDAAQDYDERAAKFWSVYVDEAESHDKALIETWKDDMEGVIIFAGLYSASLTAFLAESYQNLQPDPVQDNVYWTRQSVRLLAQISAQLAASGSPVPSNVDFPPEIAPFHATSSDVRVNVYWFMSLIFSLTAALAATIVQQWVRDYMHVFQRYNHPLKRARIRQFLFEGADGWYMSVVVDGVPALIHVSLFLFFIGLADFLFNINTPTAITSTILIVICAFLYIWSVIAPVHDPQSPYQSPLSGICWLLYQKIRRRTRPVYRPSSSQKRISSNMTDGRVQLAMDESGERKKRDARAIHWVIDNLTEDSELEPFVLGIPGSLHSKWGKMVWEAFAVGEGSGRTNPHTPEPIGATSEMVVASPHSPGRPAIQSTATGTPTRGEDPLKALGSRITRLFKTCTDPGILPTEEERRKRARACVDAALSLVLSMEDHNWDWFAEPEIVAQTLTYLGDVERIRAPPPIGFDSIFAVRWTCLSIISVHKMLQTSSVPDAAQRVITSLALVRGERGANTDDAAVKTAGIIDQCFKSGWESADILDRELNREVEADKVEELFEEIVTGNKKVDVAELEYTWNILGWAQDTDESIISLVRTMVHATSGILNHFPGVVLPWLPDRRRQPDKGVRAIPTHLMPQFIPPRLLTQRLWICTWALRNIAQAGWGNSSFQMKTLGELSAPELHVPEIRALMSETPAPMKTQLWRLQDLRDGGLVYMLELLIAAIRASKAASHHSSREQFLGTFDNVTSEWERHQHAQGTQRLLVNLLRQVLPENNDAPSDELPPYIIDHFLSFIGKVLAGKKGSHVNDAKSLIEAYVELRGGSHEVAHKALLAISPPPPPKTKRHRGSNARTVTT
ncbi:hypothetical protein BC834DRAFT_1042990 [Gloeopeniophorella convolvens]|nr:hypothetical protein BC834DRAFT_1042990 [Gloeopeniophorella convolvens]